MKKGWSQERNFNKMRVAGMISTIRSLRGALSTTTSEAAWLNDALKSLSNIYDRWEKSNVASKKKFLEG
jgi:tyrosyl-tRNA synthetase